MKKILTISFISLTIMGTAHADKPWWQQATICRLNPSNCYVSMGAGYDPEMWDADANCWGLKYICPQAIIKNQNNPTGAPVAMTRAEIASGTTISQDFDTSILNGDCFGARRTIANGSQALVNGKPVNVWCNGLLDEADETLANGEIMYSGSPKCSDLADRGYLGVINGRCYGKYYNTNDYAIDCDTSSSALTPKRLIILNGADPDSTGVNTPDTMAKANETFDKMQKNSAAQREKYFENQ